MPGCRLRRPLELAYVYVFRFMKSVFDVHQILAKPARGHCAFNDKPAGAVRQAGHAPHSDMGQPGGKELYTRTDLAALAALDAGAALRALGGSLDGLAPEEAAARLLLHGRNLVVERRAAHPMSLLLAGFTRPLPLLLLALAGLDLVTGQRISAAVIATIVVLSCLLGLVQEYRAQRAEQGLRALVRSEAQVIRRRPDGGADGVRPLPTEELVPGDIIALSAGDLVPADLRFLETVDLFLDQSALTGEALPVGKHAGPVHAAAADLEFDNLGFMGTHVTSGSARALVIATGARTSFGQLAAALAEARERTDFDRGIERVVALLLRFMLVMALLVLLLNWATKGDFHQALLFASAVAVGLAPEMLPMIVTVNLARGALRLATCGIIVKRLGAVQALGAIDVLCADKTGTLTQDRVVLERHVDIAGKESSRVLDYAYLNSYYQTGLRNLLDAAVLRHADVHVRVAAERDWRKVGEIPFDFERRRMSVVLERFGGGRVLVCKGAVEEVAAACTSAELDGERVSFGSGHAATLGGVAERLNADGLRVIAIAWRRLDPDETCLTDPALERQLVLLGYTAFFDPPGNRRRRRSARWPVAALPSRCSAATTPPSAPTFAAWSGSTPVPS